MNDLIKNTNDDLASGEILTETAEPLLCVKDKPRKGLFNRIRNFIFCLLVIVYIFAIIISGYWYWSRPVRKDQINNAYEWWSELAEVYNIPLPKDERWSD